MGERIAVLASGGVDSTTCVFLLKGKSYDVAAFTMKLFDDSKETIDAAKERIKILGVDHQILDLVEIFRDKVINYFVKAYLSGLTPNPCCICNRYIKFGQVLEVLTGRLGFSKIATGHYAKVCEYKGAITICEGKDKSKDQSYFLSLVKPENLSKVLFPLSEYTKREIVEFAKEKLGIISTMKGSQEICFLKGKSVGEFIVKMGIEPKEGPIVFKGKEVGKHKGIFNYTIGQRRFGLSLGVPLYVVKIDPEKNAIYIDQEEALYKKVIIADNVNIFVPPTCWESPTVRIRYRSEKIPVKDISMSNNTIKVELTKPVRAPTPGQILAIYDEEVLLLGAIIKEAY